MCLLKIEGEDFELKPDYTTRSLVITSLGDWTYDQAERVKEYLREKGLAALGSKVLGMFALAADHGYGIKLLFEDITGGFHELDIERALKDYPDWEKKQQEMAAVAA